MKREAASACSAYSGSRNLMATRRSSRVSVASTTTPIPPVPMVRSTRYLPARMVPASIGDPTLSYFTRSAPQLDTFNQLASFCKQHGAYTLQRVGWFALLLVKVAGTPPAHDLHPGQPRKAAEIAKARRLRAGAPRRSGGLWA